MSTKHLAAYRAGGLLNRAIWHLEQALFACDVSQAARFVDVLGQLEAAVLGMLPSSQARPIQLRLAEIADDWRGYPSETRAEEWNSRFRDLESSLSCYSTDEAIQEAFPDLVVWLNETTKELRSLVEGGVLPSEVSHTIFLLGYFLDQLLHPQGVRTRLFQYVEEDPPRVQPDDHGLGPDSQANTRPEVAALGPMTRLTVSCLEEGAIPPSKKLIRQIGAMWGKLNTSTELPASLNDIADQQELSARRATAGEVATTIAAALTGLPEIGSGSPQDPALPASTVADSGTNCREVSGVEAATTPEGGASDHVDWAEYQRLLAIKKRIDPDDRYRGESLPTLRVFERISQLNEDCNSPVLLLGPTGAGKTELVELIHKSSARGKKPFRIEQASANKSDDKTITVARWAGHGRDSGLPNVPPKGTDGLLQECSGGTIFLDEAADLDPHFQTFILQVLDRRPIPPADGRGAPVVPDIRLILAMNRDIEEEVKAGRTREDLYRRIRARIVEIPPLKERIDDVFDFVGLVFKDRRPSDRFLLGLLRYDWPGNVGELLDVLGMAHRDSKDGERLALAYMAKSNSGVVTGLESLSDEQCAGEVVRLLTQVLRNQGFEKHRGLHKRMAKILGVSNATISRLAKQYSCTNGV